MSLLFRRSKALESQIDELLDATSEGGMVFEKGIEHFLKSDEELFQQRLQSLRELDKRTLDLRRQIESDLYSHSLMPQHRGDVVELLDQVYHLLNGAKKTLKQFDVERPKIPHDLEEGFRQLARASIEAVEELIRAVRVFFRDVYAVKDYLHKVRFLESEADRSSDALKRKIFRGELDLARKIHLRYFALHIEQLSDHAEKVADLLTILAIKQTL